MSKVKPKKHLGQHFLTNESIAKSIVDSLSADTNGNLLEIGPGMGVLTKYLIEKKWYKFWAVDLDLESIDYLKKKYPASSQQFLYNDFLKLDTSALFESDFSVIGNFPYNISSQIFFKVLENRMRIVEVVGMLQKEVAERICATHGSKTYGILSVLLQVHYTAELLLDVNASDFVPPPKVQSAVVKLRRRPESLLTCDEKLFRSVVKMAFNTRRKTLRNALKPLQLPNQLTAETIFDKRAEQLSPTEFVNLVNDISQWK